MDKLISHLLENGIYLSKEGDKLNIEYNGDSISKDLLETIRHNKTELLTYLTKVKVKSHYQDIDPVKSTGSFQLSSAQKRLWILCQFEEGSVAYNMPATISLEKSLDVESFKKAIDSVIERHEILRTVFKEDESGEIKQWILNKEDLNFKIDYKDYTKEADQEEKVNAYVQEDSYKPFDLEKGPLLRAALLQTQDKEYIFYYNLHHIISDGWSMDVLKKDVFSYYESYKEKKIPKLKALKIQYKDYSAWQIARLAEEPFKIHRDYWLNKLREELPLLDLPCTKQRPRIRTNNGQGLSTYIDERTTSKLKKYSEANGGSLFMGLLAAWNILMYHYTSQTDIITGTPVAGREHADLEDQIGFYINTLALRNQVNPGESFNTFYKTLKDNTIKSYNHQMYPFDQLVEELDPARDTSRNVVFDVMFILQNNREKTQDIKLNPEEINQLKDLGYSASKFDIEIEVHETGDYLLFQVIYNPDVYEREMVEGLIKHYKQLLNALLEDPSKQISQINYLSLEEKQELLVKFNDTNVDYPKDKTLVDLFEQQVERTPDNIALIFEDRELTYKELNEQSNQLAQYLQKNYAVKPEDLIAIQLNRSHWMIISVLAVLKAGGAYVPIDPGYPEDRINYIKKDTKCKLCLDEDELTRFKKNQKKYSTKQISSSITPGNLAYVIYTSGSTGNPKGVMLEHKNAVSFIKWSHDEFKNSEFDKVLFTTSLNFDLSVFEIFYTLTIGKELIVLQDGLSIAKYVDKGKKLLVNTVPSVVGALLQQNMSFDSISVLNMAGEPIPLNYKMELKGKVKEIRNLYGPSEDTTYSTFFRIDKDNRDLIGKPISNTRVYILNQYHQLQPIGVVGEICIGGAGLGRGYLNQEALSKEKFIQDPFKQGSRLYKTGDLGRWLPDGNIEFLGRKDDQVKIRGYRIELGETEQALLKHEQIDEAVVLAKTNQNNEKELVAYITSKQEQNISELRSYLKTILPEYMLPAYYVQLKKLPLNPNGKIDKKALPDPHGLALLSGVEYVAPRNAIEEKLVKIWQEILQRETISIKDDFFALGGHSLKAVRLSNEYARKLSVKLSLKDLFTHTSIESHAKLIQPNNQQTFIHIPKAGRQASYPISDAQRRLWILSQFSGASVAYNISGYLFIDNVDVECFKRAIHSTIERHEILRTIFKEDEKAEVRQWILKKEDFIFNIDYKDYTKEKNKEEKVQEYIAEDSTKAFDLEQGPLLRTALLQRKDKEYIFYYNMHHIISDGWSMEVLAKDVFAYYDAYKENKEPSLKDLPIQYKDYSVWQLNSLQDESYKQHAAYWLDKLSGELPLLDLPTTLQRPAIKTYNGRTLSTHLDRSLAQNLKDYSLQQGGTLFMGLLASLNAILYRYTGQTDLLIGSPIAGREHADTQDQIGFYANTLALRTPVHAQENFNELFSKVKQVTIAAYAHQMYPFDRLVEELELVRDTSRNAIFDIMLVLQNKGENEVDLNSVTTRFKEEEELNKTVDHGSKTSKFDLLIHVKEQGDYLSFSVEYNTDLYEEKMIERFITHYKRLLSALLFDPKQALGKIDYLLDDEKQELLYTFNNTSIDYGRKTVMELFEEQVNKTPHQNALIFEDKILTYKELNDQSNTLAHILKEHYQVSNRSYVGVMLERSPESVVAMIGVMKAGACYIPVDHNYPTERVEYIINDARPLVIISTEILWSKHVIKENLFLDIEKLDLAKSTQSNPAYINQLQDGSYVIYTSGSTGKPKGVLQTHRTMSNLVQWEMHHSGIKRNLKHLQYTSFSFDVHLQDYWAALCAGGVIYIANEKIRTDFSALWTYILINEIEVLSFPVSAFQQLLIQNSDQNLNTLSFKHVVVSGEQLFINASLQKFLELNPELKLHNHYGPSESHVVTSYTMSFELSNIKSHAPIGAPVSNSRIYILDENKNLVPIGVKGELYIGGDNLAISYLNKEELSTEKFVKDPFQPGHLVYKTGDHGYWREDGNIEFIGRKDDQLKIRGYRIELGEIEHALQNYKAIETAVVLAKENEHHEKELVAYIIAKTEQNTSELRSYLKTILPEYMLPAYYVQLKELPLNPNGKIDKKALPNPHGLALLSGVEYIAPRNAIEEKLVKIWQEILQRENIGIKDDFFALGGQSLKAVRLSNEYARKLSVKLSLKDLFTHTSIESHSALIRSLKQESFIQINKASPQSSYPLSDAQRRLWVLSQFEGVSASYNLPGEINLNQYIDIESFKRAIDSVIERHEILRTVFKEDESGEIKQWILNKEDLSFNIDYKDYTTQTNKEEKAKQYITEDSYKPFDLAQGPLLRAALLHLKEDTYIFYFNMHHIISDGWSMEVLTKDVLLYYHAYKENKEAELKPLPIQYKDYSAWQLSQQQEESNNLHRDFWLESLSGELPLLDLPGTKQRPRIKTNNGQSISTYIDADITGKLRNYSHAHGGSLFMSLLAAWNVLIYRYTSQTDIITGTPVAGRDHADLEDQIGFYINTLALRNQVNPSESFNAFYKTLKDNILKSYSHQLYPFDRLVEELNLQRDTGRSPVFDISITYHNPLDIAGLDSFNTGITDELSDNGESKVKFDIELHFQEQGNYLFFHLIYNADIYHYEMIENLIKHYKQLVKSLLENPQEKLSHINYLSQEEKQELLVKFNDTKVDYPKDKTLIDLFEQQAAKTPANIAVVFEEKTLTYKELDEKSNQLADHLRHNYTIGTEDLIGIQLDRSHWMIISILAVLKAGGAYVPIDPEYPSLRKEYIIKDAAIKLLITEANLIHDIDYYEGEVFAIDVEFDAEKHSRKKLSAKITPNNLAYVIYTSGSTGNPKGVMVEHATLANLCFWHQTSFSVTEKDRASLYAGVAFDASVWELFPYLVSGACLYIVPQKIRLNSNELNSFYEKNKITIGFLPTPIAEQFLEVENKSLRYLLTGGDKLNCFKKKNYQLVNNYGPTENTVVTTSYEVNDNYLNIPIGKPISNTQVYVLSEKEQLQAKGLIGEIYIGGSGLARGYLNQEELTKEKFIRNPFKEGERLYKTGDIGRWTTDGNIEFLGRKDDQVKIRGYRIELGEIEHALLKHDQVEAVVVLAKQTQNHEKELVAYITAKTKQNADDLMYYLKELLPAYMLPSYYIQLQSLPLTSNGKIDKKSLPEPEGMALSNSVEYVAPRNEIEEKLVKIWQEVLQRENIGVKDDFFALGGQSLKAVRLSNEYQKELSVKILLKDLFVYTSIESHAELIDVRNWIGIDPEAEKKENNMETFNF